jgi:hypothetical protein
MCAWEGLVVKIPLLACVGKVCGSVSKRDLGIRSLGMSWTDNAPGVREVCMSHPYQGRRTRPRRQTNSTQAPAPQGGLRRTASAGARVLHRDLLSGPRSTRRDEVSRFLHRVSMEGPGLQFPARLLSAEQAACYMQARLNGGVQTHAGGLDRVDWIHLEVSLNTVNRISNRPVTAARSGHSG